MNIIYKETDRYKLYYVASKAIIINIYFKKDYL